MLLDDPRGSSDDVRGPDRVLRRHFGESSSSKQFQSSWRDNPLARLPRGVDPTLSALGTGRNRAGDHLAFIRGVDGTTRVGTGACARGRIPCLCSPPCVGRADQLVRASCVLRRTLGLQRLGRRVGDLSLPVQWRGLADQGCGARSARCCWRERISTARMGLPTWRRADSLRGCAPFGRRVRESVNFVSHWPRPIEPHAGVERLGQFHFRLSGPPDDLLLRCWTKPGCSVKRPNRWTCV